MGKYDFLSAPKTLDIVYEDENILLVDKKQGLLVHPDKNEYTNTLIARIQHYLYDKGEYNPEEENSFRPALANRIDRNTGGIAGTMAIEYSKDPEDDIEKPNTLNFTYRTKTILQGCINDGKVAGKKDCAGGITGFSEIGTIYECQNYADIESKNGNYVGGVAGKSESTIRKSYAKQGKFIP